MTILPGLTSTKKDRIQAFIQALKDTKTKYISLFPTCLLNDERQQLYSELKNISGLCIPHVHLRTGIDENEMTFLVNTFGTELFNIHPDSSKYPFLDIPEKYKNKVYVENVDDPPSIDEVKDKAGICIDFSHWENAIMCNYPNYDNQMKKLCSKFSIGCCHISAIRTYERNHWANEWDFHQFKKLSDLDYISKYKELMPPKWASLELENSLYEQLEAKEYLEKMLDRNT